MGNKNSSKSKTDSQQTSTTEKDKLHGLGSVIRLLPTGTVFLFQFLDPVLTNNGKCHTANKYLSARQIGVCGLSCSFGCFTDSYKGKFGLTYYRVATTKDHWLGSSSKDLWGHKLRFRDFVHTFMSVLRFAVVVLLDTTTMRCFYRSLGNMQNTLIMVLPPVTGTILGMVFTLFPPSAAGLGILPVRVRLPQRPRLPQRLVLPRRAKPGSLMINISTSA